MKHKSGHYASIRQYTERSPQLKLRTIKKFLYQHKIFCFIMVTGLSLRILLNSVVDSFDFYAFVMWAKYLTTHRIADVFEFLPDGYTPYPPVYYYVLWVLGRVISMLQLWDNKWWTYLIIRLPVFLADLGVTTAIYWFAQKFFSKKTAIWGAAFYFLHPALIYNTSVWGQIDALIILLGIMSLASFIKNRGFWAVGFYVLDVLTKLQSLALLPLILFLSFTRIKLKQLIQLGFIWGLLALLPFWPVVASKGLKWTWDYFFTIPNWYAYTSVYAYNLWAPFGFIVSDNTKLWGIVQYKYIGILLFWFVALLILRPLYKKINRRPEVILFAAFLLWFDFSFFATRIHSRYLIYSFGFFAPFAAVFPSIAIALTALMVGNLILPLKTPWLLPLINFLNAPITIMVVTILAFLLFIHAYRKYQVLIKRVATK